MLQSQIVCHTFPCFSQPSALWNWMIETRDMPKDSGLFYVVFPTVSLYIQWGQFIIVQVTLPTPSHQVTSIFLLDFKRLLLNILNIVTFLTLKVAIGDRPNRLKTIMTIFKCESSNSTLIETVILFSQLAVNFQKNISHLIHQHFFHVSITIIKLMSRKGIIEVIPENIPDLEEPCPMFLLTKATRIPRGPTTDASNISYGFMLQMDFSFFQFWKHLWIYLDVCRYMLYYFIPLWISVQKQISTSW